jgi:hypothetical protein
MNQLNTTAQRTAVDKGPRQQAMEQLLVGLRRVRISGWLLAGLLLTTLFLILNRELISGARVETWDATAYYTPAFSLVADHAVLAACFSGILGWQAEHQILLIPRLAQHPPLW